MEGHTQLERERDFYRHLLELGAQIEIEPLLEKALSLIVQLTGARRGYLELDDGHGRAPPRFWIAHGCYDTDVEEIRAEFSSGVISEAIATGKTLLVESASRDSRFEKRKSVRRNRIEAVLCAPIGAHPPLGVVYLQDRTQPGSFSEDDRRCAEIFARHLATLADRLLLHRKQRDEQDPTLPYRQKLQAADVVGRSQAVAALLKDVSLVAPLEISVLLTGPSGSGKTQIAQVIHRNSPRASGPFVEINCAALPESLVESELFGALPGAHSTANRRVEGKVAAAEGGTLFLDEVGDLPVYAQAKLLQLLQSREYYPLGGAKPVRANVRIVAATNVDLRAAVAKKTFREDLLYRLEVLPVRVPALAERQEDIETLARHFCARACEVHRLGHLQFSPEALRTMATEQWPGNIRELAHRVEAAAIRTAGDQVPQIERRHLFPESPEGTTETRGMTFQEATRQYQERLLRERLETNDWNISETASQLDLSRSHLYNLISAFGLERNRR